MPSQCCFVCVGACARDFKCRAGLTLKLAPWQRQKHKNDEEISGTALSMRTLATKAVERVLQTYTHGCSPFLLLPFSWFYHVFPSRRCIVHTFVLGRRWAMERRNSRE